MYVPSRYHQLSNSSRFDEHADATLMPRDYDALQSYFFAYADADEEAIDYVLKGEMDVITAGMLSRSAGAEVVIKDEVTYENGRRIRKPKAQRPRDPMRQSAAEANAQYEKMLEQVKEKDQERMLYQLEAKQAIVTALLRAGESIADVERRFCADMRPCLIQFFDKKALAKVETPADLAKLTPEKMSVLLPLAQYTNKTPVLVYDGQFLTHEEMVKRNGGRFVANADALFEPMPTCMPPLPEMLRPRPADVRQSKDALYTSLPEARKKLEQFKRRFKFSSETIARRAHIRALNEAQKRAKKAVSRPEPTPKAPKAPRSLHSQYSNPHFAGIGKAA